MTLIRRVFVCYRKQVYSDSIMSSIKRTMSELNDNFFVTGRFGSARKPRSGLCTPSPPPRISNSPTLFFGDIGSFSKIVSAFYSLVLVLRASYTSSMIAIFYTFHKKNGKDHIYTISNIMYDQRVINLLEHLLQRSETFEHPFWLQTKSDAAMYNSPAFTLSPLRESLIV